MRKLTTSPQMSCRESTVLLQLTRVKSKGNYRSVDLHASGDPERLPMQNPRSLERILLRPYIVYRSRDVADEHELIGSTPRRRGW
jgi:hypothetical protein